jgi:hypothetical protein
MGHKTLISIKISNYFFYFIKGVFTGKKVCNSSPNTKKKSFSLEGIEQNKTRIKIVLLHATKASKRKNTKKNSSSIVTK